MVAPARPAVEGGRAAASATPFLGHLLALASRTSTLQSALARESSRGGGWARSTLASWPPGSSLTEDVIQEDDCHVRGSNLVCGFGAGHGQWRPTLLSNTMTNGGMR